jgi:predicted TIM-barrel fold metal-dependent hydrolase
LTSDAQLISWLERLREEVPGLELFDAHTHIGSNDPDGYRCSADELLAALAAADARAVVFPMHEPGGYPPANDRVIDNALASEGRLVALCRLDPEDSPLAEAERCLERGARGVKLHPRAERFALDHPALQDVFELAGERGIPVLSHAGRGIPALGRHVLQACERYPRMKLILAHAGISDLAWIWREAPGHPNLFFDTSWWSPSDLLALFCLVAPGQILMASDAPYTNPALGAAMTLRYALQAGLSPDAVRSVAGGQTARLVEGSEPLDLGPAGQTQQLSLDPLLDRVHSFLMSALGQMYQGFEPVELLELAALACHVDDDAPQAPVCRSILALLAFRESYEPAPGERPPRFAKGVHLVVAAACLARTPSVPLPRDPAPA